MRKYTKFIVVAGVVTALAAPAAAMANSSSMNNPGPGKGIVGSGAVVSGSFYAGTPQGKNQGVTQYRATYTDPVFGPVSCIGTNHAAVASKAAEFDSFTCTSTSNSPLTNVTPNETLSLGGTVPGWVSDFDGHTASNFTGTVSADRMSYTATATY
jgi:hypothetical protein